MHPFQTKWTPFLFKHFPFYPLHRGCAASFPPRVCNLWIDLLQSWICFITPSCFFIHPIRCAFGLYSSKLERIYASLFMHLTRYDTCSSFCFFIPTPSIPPNILSLALAQILSARFSSSSRISSLGQERAPSRAWGCHSVCCVCNVCGLRQLFWYGVERVV